MSSASTSTSASCDTAAPAALLTCARTTAL